MDSVTAKTNGTSHQYEAGAGHALSVQEQNIPAVLKAVPQWLVWKYTEVIDEETGETYFTKPPLNARGGAGSSTKPKTWSTFETALAAMKDKRLSGIGFVLHAKPEELVRLVGIDLDHCRDPQTGAISEWAREIIDRITSYTEVSPSGCGVRIFLRGKLPSFGRKKGDYENYENGRYVTVTGHHVEGTPLTIEHRQAELDEIHKAIFGEAIKASQQGPANNGGSIEIDLDDAEIIRKAFKAKNGSKFKALWEGDTSGYLSPSEADLALCNYLAFWCRDSDRVDVLFRQSGLVRPKWNRDDYRDKTLRLATEGRTTFYEPRRKRISIQGANGHNKPKLANGEASQQAASLPSNKTEQIADGESSDDVIEHLLSRAATNPNEVIDLVLEKHLPAIAALVAEAPGKLETFFRRLQDAGAKTGELNGLRQAVNREHKRLRKEQKAKARENKQGAFRQEADSFSNYKEEEIDCGEDGTRTAKIGVPVQMIADKLEEQTQGWPKRVGNLLFACTEEYKPQWLESPPATFAWIAGQLPDGGNNRLQWASGEDKITESQFHAYLSQCAESFDALELFPHYPLLSRCYYMHPKPTGGDGVHLADLLRRFNSASDIDGDLLKACFLSPFWGGPPGKKPAFLFKGVDGDPDGGRGAGKSTVAQMIGRLRNGHIDLSTNEPMEKVITRLLSPDAMERGIVLLDNIKSLKFSWAELEGLITSDSISGHRLYHGEGRRPNNLTYFLTLNGACLSKDMAQRCVIIEIKRPKFSATWEEEVIAYIEENRWAIIGDILAELRRKVDPLNRFSRWGSWEQAVLSKVAEPADCQKVMLERQEVADEDAAETANVKEMFKAKIRQYGHNPDHACVFIPTKMAADWVGEATNEKKATNKQSSYLSTLTIPELRKGADETGNRGWTWTGTEATGGGKRVQVCSY